MQVLTLKALRDHIAIFKQRKWKYTTTRTLPTPKITGVGENGPII